ncbi:hypothetical protein PUR23_29060 [Methylorubrum populi]|uniref:hypothetical protein n=1 Tax=Methylorubrum populi TaxID=223967 RepID=UPI0031F88320
MCNIAENRFKINIDQMMLGANMKAVRINAIVRFVVVLIGLAVLLPGCVGTGGSTSGHVDAKLREHGV